MSYDLLDDAIDDKGHCNHCRKNVTVRMEDFGIGLYEYWGHKEHDSDKRPVCTECDSVLEDL